MARSVIVEEPDIIVSTTELAEILKVTPRDIQYLTSVGLLTYIENYKRKTDRMRFYRLSKALSEYKTYICEIKGSGQNLDANNSCSEGITIVKDIDITKYKYNKKVYYDE